MTGWHTLACALGNAAHECWNYEQRLKRRRGRFLRSPAKGNRIRLAKAYLNYRIEICRQLRGCDPRKKEVRR